MHLKNIPDSIARQIKSRAVAMGLSPSEYFIHLHFKCLPESVEEADHAEPLPKDFSKKKNSKKKKRGF